MRVSGFDTNGEIHYFTADTYKEAIALCDALTIAGWTGCDIVC